jgi:hypothetical protein
MVSDMRRNMEKVQGVDGSEGLSVSDIRCLYTTEYPLTAT